MTAPSPLEEFLARQSRARRGDLWIAGAAGAVGALAATWLLGLSGWFLAGAALAGAGGPALVQAFNYLLPSAAIRALAIARTVSRYAERLFGHRAALRALAALRPALFAGLAAAPPDRSLGLSSGEASARLVQDVEALETAFVRRSAPWTLAAAAAGAAAVIVLASPWAALAFLAGLALQLLLGVGLASRLVADTGGEQLRAAGRLKDGLNAYLAAAEELSSFDLTSRAVEALMAHDARLSDLAIRRADAEATSSAAQALLTAIVVVMVAVLSSTASLPHQALAVLATLAGLEGVAGLVRAAQQREAYRTALGRIDAILIAPPTAFAPPPLDAALEVLGEVMEPGTRMAITGPSGCGKTTILQTLVGLRAPAPGVIRVNGAPLEDATIGWARNLFAYAPQDARLLTGTVGENLRLAAPDADDAALWDALADAQLATRVRALPAGLQTWIGDGGEALSGGERRRLSLARAYLRAAPWLLLDEPSEGLDGETEAAVVDALERRLERTAQGLLLVSHRPVPLRLSARRLAVPVRGPPTTRSAESNSRQDKP
jgi:ATP-binding cassette subfamily C protein CydC